MPFVLTSFEVTLRMSSAIWAASTKARHRNEDNTGLVTQGNQPFEHIRIKRPGRRHGSLEGRPHHLSGNGLAGDGTVIGGRVGKHQSCQITKINVVFDAELSNASLQGYLPWSRVESLRPRLSSNLAGLVLTHPATNDSSIPGKAISTQVDGVCPQGFRVGALAA